MCLFISVKGKTEFVFEIGTKDILLQVFAASDEERHAWMTLIAEAQAPAR